MDNIYEAKIIKNAKELESKILDYLKKKAVFNDNKTRDTFFEMDEARDEICCSIMKIQSNIEYYYNCLSDETKEKVNQLSTLLYSILLQDNLISRARFNIIEQQNAQKRLEDIKMLKEAYTNFDKETDNLLTKLKEINIEKNMSK